MHQALNNHLVPRASVRKISRSGPPQVEPDRLVWCQTCKQDRQPTDDWRCSVCGDWCGYATQYEACPHCPRTERIPQIRRYYEWSSTCICQIHDPKAYAAGQAERDSRDARETARAARIKKAREDAAAERQAAADRAVEEKSLRNFANDCLRRRNNCCAVQLSAPEYKACRVCKKFEGTEDAKRKPRQRCKASHRGN